MVDISKAEPTNSQLLKWKAEARGEAKTFALELTRGRGHDGYPSREEVDRLEGLLMKWYIKGLVAGGKSKSEG